ncbi:MAG: ABC transporter ATP-binding protein [Actinobacteria bacterium]|nr:MAG: ABC transporter ATP-binding protein [Actinomycetota bacterium]
MKALTLERVSVTLGGARVLSGLSAEVEGGEWVAVIGPNGAGKTTALRAVAGLVPYEGRVRVLEDDAHALARKHLARRVALVPQVPLIPGDITVRAYVLLGRTPHLGYFGTERRKDHHAVDAALAQLDLVAFAGRRLDTLSGGERQRATLARALAQDAPVLLLDEPTAALDMGRQQQVLEIVDELRTSRGLTVVSTMHDLTLAGQYADRLLLVDGGRLVAAGPPDDVLTRALITEHYGAEVEVVDAPGSGFVVVPVRRTS